MTTITSRAYRPATPGWARWIGVGFAASLVLGALLPTLIAWFVVAPLKGPPMAAGFAPLSMVFGLIVNGAWGFGTGLGRALFGGKRPERRLAAINRRLLDRRRPGELYPGAV